MYILKTSDGQHQQLGTSSGYRQNLGHNSFWITGWSPQTQQAVIIGGSYFLSNAYGNNFNSVEVKEVGGSGMGGIRFELNQ